MLWFAGGVVFIMYCRALFPYHASHPDMEYVYGLASTVESEVFAFYEKNHRLPVDIRETGFNGETIKRLRQLWPCLHYLPVTEKRFVLWLSSEPNLKSRLGRWFSQIKPPPEEPDYIRESKGRILAELVTTSSCASDWSRWLVEHPEGTNYVFVCDVTDEYPDHMSSGNFRPSIIDVSTTASAKGTTETRSSAAF